MVAELKTKNDWDSLMSSGKTVVVDFHAVWCGPCKMIAPTYAKLADELGSDSVVFVKVDVDEMPEVSEAAGITAMPTFQIYKAGSKVGELRGASPAKLEELIRSNL
ncbi:hypothetical protein HK102_005370 [Quaeritorhiza haematococci]|nr:hypothetical protein HK102_005370 [Quaeritorhiza haematococci]